MHPNHNRWWVYQHLLFPSLCYCAFGRLPTLSVGCVFESEGKIFLQNETVVPLSVRVAGRGRGRVQTRDMQVTYNTPLGGSQRLPHLCLLLLFNLKANPSKDRIALNEAKDVPLPLFCFVPFCLFLLARPIISKLFHIQNSLESFSVISELDSHSFKTLSSD